MPCILADVLNINTTWFLLPLAASISLVYSASRFELKERIIQRAIRLFLTILVFMTLVYAVLYLLSFRL